MPKKQRNRARRQASNESMSNASLVSNDNEPPNDMNDIEKVREFLLRCEQVRSGISEYDIISRPLYELSSASDFQWNLGCNIAYDYLKAIMAKELPRQADDRFPSVTSSPRVTQPNLTYDDDRVQNAGGDSDTHKAMTEGTARDFMGVMGELTQAIGSLKTTGNPKPRLLEEGSDSESDSPYSLPSISRVRSKHIKAKLPPYTGKELWKVWFNRFEEVADRLGWSENDRLDELLPRLQGAAGDFVFGQLSKNTRGSYKSLTRELKIRFRVIENPKAYGVKFSKRDQKCNESVEEYAASLKDLYNKAYPDRDTKTRDEDLLRRFLDGLYDEKAKEQVEFVKAPRTIDEAMFEVVNYYDTKSKVYVDRKKVIRMVKPDDSDESDGDVSTLEDTASQVNRVHVGANNKSEINDIKSSIEALAKKVDEMSGRADKKSDTKAKPRFKGSCFHCGIQGHKKVHCRKWQREQSSLNANAAPFSPKNSNDEVNVRGQNSVPATGEAVHVVSSLN